MPSLNCGLPNDDVGWRIAEKPLTEPVNGNALFPACLPFPTTLFAFPGLRQKLVNALPDAMFLIRD